MIILSAITPHPPIIIPGIGRPKDLAKVKKTIAAMEELREDLEKADPETIFIISPHAQLEADRFLINSEPVLRGSFSDFGLDEIMDFKNDRDAIDRITYFSNVSGISVHLHSSFLDHGALVPLYYLTKNIKPNIVHLAYSFLDYKTHYKYGQILAQMCCEKDKKIAIIASGDMSHCLTPNAPAGYSPRGKEFDEKLIEMLGKNDSAGIINMDPELIEEAGECGLRSVVILLGAIGDKYKFNLLNYEGPFGVGYLTAQLIAP